MDIRKISLHLSGKVPPYEKFSRLEFFDYLEEIFGYNLDKLDFYWKQAKEFEEEFYYLVFDKLYSKSKKDEGEKGKLDKLLLKLDLPSKIYTNNTDDNQQKDDKIKIKPLVLTEGKTDVKLLKTAWLKLNQVDDFDETNLDEKFNKNANFNIENGDLLNGEHLPKSLSSADILGNIVYYWKGESQLIGLFDRDDAGFKGFHKIDIRKSGFEEIKDDDGNSIKIKKKGGANYTTGLVYPIPLNREGYGKRDNMKSDGAIEIEYYFTDEDIKEIGFGNSITEMSDGSFKYTKLNIAKKESFANQVIKEQSRVDFSNFKILFDKINEILNH